MQRVHGFSTLGVIWGPTPAQRHLYIQVGLPLIHLDERIDHLATNESPLSLFAQEKTYMIPGCMFNPRRFVFMQDLRSTIRRDPA